MKEEKAGEHRRTIALFTQQSRGPVLSAFWKGAHDYALSKGLDLFILDGGVVQTEDPTEKAMCQVFDLAHFPRIDGILALTGTIIMPSGDDVEAGRKNCFGGKPLVILNTPNTYFPSVTIDNTTGVLESVAHLVAVHGCRKIAFLRGDEDSFDAEIRFAAYKEGLERAGIEFDSSLAFPGDFTFDSGRILAEALSRSLIPSFDALITASDEMAIGFQTTIERLGYKIPEDIALIGFDDDDVSAYLECPLTTVHQPYIHMCEHGIDMLIKLLDGEKVDDVVLPAHFIIRESCGCVLSTKKEDREHLHTERYLKKENISLKKALTIINNFSCKAQGTHRSNNLVAAFNKAIPEVELNYVAVSLIQLNEKKSTSDSSQTNVEDSSGADRFHGLPEKVLLTYLYRNGIDEDRDLNPLSYPLSEILPASAMQKRSPQVNLVMPLVDAETLLGFLFFELGKPDPVIYELFRSQVSSIIGRTMLMEILIEKETRELVEMEKMKALGTLVAGVAHEINTPMGISVTAASHLNCVVKDFETTFEEGSMTKTGLRDFLRDIQESAQLLEKNLERSSFLVSSFKKVAVDSSSEERRAFKIKEYVSDILVTLSPRLKKTKVAVSVDCPDSLEIDSYPGAFSQILTNLIVNSLDHGFDTNSEGEIKIAFKIREGSLMWTYSDDGKGIDSQISSRIFEPFITTRRELGGSGLGLHIVYNTVTGVFKGKIQFFSALGKGVLFTITIPLLSKEK